MLMALEVLQESAARYSGVSITSAELTQLRADIVRITVTGEGELSGTGKASLMKSLIGVILPDIGTVAGVRLQITSGDAFAVAELDIDLPFNTKAWKITQSPFGGPLRFNQRQSRWLYERGFPVPGVPGYRYDHPTYQAPGRN